MAEIEYKNTFKKSNPTKSMWVLATNTLREMVVTVNESGIKKEDIVSLLKDNGQFCLIYYR